jgi:signal transduction histidine kinase
MAQLQALGAPPAARRWAARLRVDNGLVRWVARAPATVRTKLLVAFLAIASLLVIVTALGVDFLRHDNARVVRLGALQLRSSTYQALEAYATDLRQTLGVRAAGTPAVTPYTGGKTLQGGETWVLADLQVADTLSQVELGADEALFGFVPPPADERVLRRVRSDYRDIVGALAHIRRLDDGGVRGYRAQPYIRAAIDADNDLAEQTATLAERTKVETAELVTANRSAYGSSRNLFVAVSAASVALALALGLILARALIRPIQRTEARLSEISEGDFSGRLDIPNRDELGSLGENVNRMNDELRRLYGELEAASRHKSAFLASMSHELRTPLNAIIGFSDVLHEEMFGELNERQRECVRDVLDASRHLLSLINEVLDLAKVEAGRMELELSDVSLSETLRAGLTMHAERASRGGVALGLDLDHADVIVEADERKLRQAVFNLVSNAVKFTPPGGRVDVSAQLAADVVEVAVTDTGLGIAAGDRELIFDEFRQANGPRDDGTGLGLPIARRFIELHGGRLWVESGPGTGSTFRFTVPVRQRVEA